MSIQFRLYAVSMMAIIRDPTADGGEIVRYMHHPSLYFGNSMQTAKAQAELDALSMWPLDQGYSQHQLVIDAVPATVYGAISGYHRDGLLTTEPDPSETLTEFYLDAGLSSEDFDLHTPRNIQ